MEFDADNTMMGDYVGHKVFYVSGQFTSIIKDSHSDSPLVDVAGVSVDETDMYWTDVTNGKLLYQSGKIDSATVKDSISTGKGASTRGISWDGTNAIWSAFNTDYYYLTSGRFSSAIKLSEAYSGYEDIIQDVSFTGVHTLSVGSDGIKLYKVSGQFSTLLKDSISVLSDNSVPTSISTTDFNGRIGAAGPAAASIIPILQYIYRRRRS